MHKFKQEACAVISHCHYGLALSVRLFFISLSCPVTICLYQSWA